MQFLANIRAHLDSVGFHSVIVVANSAEILPDTVGDLGSAKLCHALE
jgi:hypothetical protein